MFCSLQDLLHCYLLSIPNFAGLPLNSFCFFPLVWLSFADLNPCRDYASRSLCVYGHVPPTKDTGQTLRSSFKSPNQLSSPRFSSPTDSLPYLQTHKLSGNLLENCRLLLCCAVPTPGRCHRAKSLFFLHFFFVVIALVLFYVCAEAQWHPGLPANTKVPWGSHLTRTTQGWITPSPQKSCLEVHFGWS